MRSEEKNDGLKKLRSETKLTNSSSKKLKLPLSNAKSKIAAT